MPKIRRSTGGLIRGNLFDTNIKATSIDEDIFSEQELLDDSNACIKLAEEFINRISKVNGN